MLWIAFLCAIARKRCNLIARSMSVMLFPEGGTWFQRGLRLLTILAVHSVARSITKCVSKMHFKLVYLLIIAFRRIIFDYPAIQILRLIFHTFLHMIPKTIGYLTTSKVRVENCIELSNLVMIGDNLIEMGNNCVPQRCKVHGCIRLGVLTLSRGCLSS